jgi:predicted exporter
MRLRRSLLEGKARYLIALMILAGVGAAFWAGVERLKVETDITSALPAEDPVIHAAQQVLKHHPVLENVFIQISLTGAAAGIEPLVEAGDLASALLQKTGLVKVVSEREGAASFVSLLEFVTGNLPLFFNREELEEQVQPLIRTERVGESLREQFWKLADVGSIGQTRYLSQDPLGFRNLVLARFSAVLPLAGAGIHGGHITTPDGKHLLIVAEPLRNPRDASFALRLTEELEDISRKVAAFSAPGEGALKMISAGAFRASLDNERIIRRDTSRALMLVTLGLIPLAFLSFRRVWLGILSFVPAMAGTMLAVFVYAFTKDSIFAVTMGFGGALIGIAVDHGMAYVILLDRPYETDGWAVAREVWSVSSMTIVSTVVALLSLMATGIPLFTQLGLFSALGVGLSAIFVHVFFPVLFPRLKGSRRGKTLWMERLMDRLVASSGWRTVGGFAVFTLAMVFFAELQFSADLESMNTVSRPTREAEMTIERTWGGLVRRPCLMIREETLSGLWPKVERMGEFLEEERNAGVLEGSLPRATLLPGPRAQQGNLAAWREFWNRERVTALRAALKAGGTRAGFKADAFDPFLRTLEEPPPPRSPFPLELLTFFGIFPDRDKNGGWVFADLVSPGPRYAGEVFFQRSREEGFLSFDSAHFSRHLTRELNRSFVWMLLVVGGVTFAVLLFYFLDWQIFLLAIAPVSFSLVATLGTLGFLNRPLSIPSLMLAPLIMGLGLEQGLYLVRSFQRYGAAPDPNSDAFRVTILVCSLTTLVGFASLLFSEHAVLRDAGVSSFLGIFYATAGAFGILPPFLRLVFAEKDPPLPPPLLGSREHTERALRRYRHLEPYPRLFARFKILWDPMFPRLADFVKPSDKIIDAGCGYAAPAAWLLAVYPELSFLSCEPREERARVAARVLGRSGRVLRCPAQDLPLREEKANAALLLDVFHYFPDPDLRELLGRIRSAIGLGGRLVIRVTVPAPGFRLFRLVEELRLKVRRAKYFFRTAPQIRRILEEEGYEIVLSEPSAPGREETWFIAQVAGGKPLKADLRPAKC